MAIAAAPSVSLEGPFCLPLCGVSSRSKPSFDGQIGPHISGLSFRCRSPMSGATQFQWSVAHDILPSKVSVASDYPGSVPDSSDLPGQQGYHPLEELKVCKLTHDKRLSTAEIARTTVEANDTALLVFPGIVHCEPHESISWAEYQYHIDDFGDIFIEIFDDRNILQDHEATNPVNAFIGMDIPMHENRKAFDEYDIPGSGSGDDIPLDDGYVLDEVAEVSDNSIEREMPEDSSGVHPVYFSKCLAKAINTQHHKKMDHPSNGVSIMACLRPAFSDEDHYLRALIYDDGYGFNSHHKDGETLSFSSKSDGKVTGSILYHLEIIQMRLFSVYGSQSLVDLQDFLDAEADVLVNSTPAITENFKEKGISCNVALKALCKRKGLHVDGANLIGIDSLGIDVRVFYGVEVRTHRFPFKVRANSESAATKQIQQLLFPRSHRKKLKLHSRRRGVEDPNPL